MNIKYFSIFRKAKIETRLMIIKSFKQSPSFKLQIIGDYSNQNYLFLPELEENDELILLGAHYDTVLAPKYSANDNLASVFNLLHIKDKLHQFQKLPDFKPSNKKIGFVFFDNEERDLRGSLLVAKYFKKNNLKATLINLELTGRGNEIVSDNRLIYLKTKKCPISDHFSWKVIMPESDSFCIFLLPSKEVQSFYPKTWQKCHTKKDDINNINLQDMFDFQDRLIKIISKL